MSEIKISIKAARVNAGFTIVEASKRLGISPSTLVAWEKNQRKSVLLIKIKLLLSMVLALITLFFYPESKLKV